MTVEVAPPKNNRGKDKSEEEYERLRVEFAAWLINPQRDGSMKEWAEAHELNEHTLTEWKRRKDIREILSKWREDMQSEVPLVVARVLQAAVRGDLQAARLVGDWFGLNAPKDLNLTGQIEHVAYMPAGSLAKLATEVIAAETIIEGEIKALPEPEGEPQVVDDGEHRVPPASVPSEGPPGPE